VRFSTFHVGQLRPGISAADDLSEAIENAVLAEELGFEVCWVAEHHFTPYGTFGSPTPVLAAMAMRTSRIRLGSGIAIMPLQHPIRLAEEFALIDNVSRGRLIAGVGPGLAPRDFRGFAVDLDQRRDRFTEGVELMRLCWTEPVVRFHGRYFDVEGISVYPRPFQQPHPPIVHAATKPESQVRAAELGRPILIGRLGEEGAYESIQRYVQARRAAGHDEATILRSLDLCGVLRHIVIAESSEEAWRIAYRTAEQYLAVAADLQIVPTQPPQRPEEPEELIERGVLVGSPDEISEQIDRLHAIGVRHLICWFDWGGLDRQFVRESMQLFAERVMPEHAPLTPIALAV
jgi:alkanesulfonate monooxygenase SsuD/methylene tetrahydromethanopterin reductase-like flavin-dependent oxidoreductase (luciferase family)